MDVIGASHDAAARPTSRNRSVILALACVALGGVVLIVPLVPHLRAMAMTGALLAIAVGFIFLRTGQGALDWFEVFIPFSVIYIVYFGVGAIYNLFNPQELFSLSLKPYLEPALALSLVGYVAFTLGYGFCFRATRPSPLAAVEPRGLLAILIPGLIGFAGQMAGTLQERFILAGLGVSAPLSALQQFGLLFLIAWYLAFAQLFGDRLTRRQKLLLLALFIPMGSAVLLLKVGAKIVPITMFGIPIIAYWYARGRLPVRSLLALPVVSIFIVFPLYNTYRLQSRQLDTTERLDITVRSAATWDSATFMDRSFGSFLRRMSIVTSVAAVIRDTGRWVDYRYGETLMLAPISVLIPRFVWPDKPDINVGREFGVTFQLVNPVDRETMIALSFPGELYWNFHVPGVIAGMFLIGALYRWVYRRYGGGPRAGSIAKALYASVLVVLLQFEGNVAMMIGNLVKAILITLLCFQFLRRAGFLDAGAPDAAGGPIETP